MVLLDLDGSLTSHVNGSVVATMGILPPSSCTQSAEMSVGVVNGSICDGDVRFHRLVFDLL